MNQNEIGEKLTSIFRSVFSHPGLQLTIDMSANDVENWNSLTHMTMMAEVEQVFGIKFKLKELKKLNTVGDLIEAIQSKL